MFFQQLFRKLYMYISEAYYTEGNREAPNLRTILETLNHTSYHCHKLFKPFLWLDCIWTFLKWNIWGCKFSLHFSVFNVKTNEKYFTVLTIFLNDIGNILSNIFLLSVRGCADGEVDRVSGCEVGILKHEGTVGSLTLDGRLFRRKMTLKERS